MSPGLAGLLIGATVGLFNLIVLRSLAQRVAMPETKRLLSVVGIADLVILPVVGFLIGTYVWA